MIGHVLLQVTPVLENFPTNWAGALLSLGRQRFTARNLVRSVLMIFHVVLPFPSIHECLVTALPVAG